MIADVESICRIPIGNVGEDTWAWKHDKNNNFSVRSAYKVLCHHSNQAEERETSSRGAGESWKKLWGLKVPPKVRNFW